METQVERRPLSPVPSQSSPSPAASSAVQKRTAAGSGSFASQEAALSPNPVQRHGGGEDTGNVHAAAEQGIASGGGKLPHGDAIQSAFGSHDISAVQAHQGAAAVQATSAMGASAYASGNHVALGQGAGDLHTVAHEAAHVVQQRAGVQLSGGIGQAGDRYEQHADAVADAVVQGKSAEGLLDSMSGSGGGAQATQKSVQREGPGDAVAQAEWQKQYADTLDSYQDLIHANLLAAEAWKNTADIVDPPSGWEIALKIIGSAVLAGALGGLGGVLAGVLIKEGAKLVTQFVLNAAIEAGKKAAEEGVMTAVGSSAGAGEKAPLVAFCEQQRLGLAQAQWQAKDKFKESSGNSAQPNITADDMKAIQVGNKAARNNAGAIQSKEMLIGWMNLIAGGSGVQDADKEASSETGILTLVVDGVQDTAYSIKSARTDGINEQLKGSISGTKLSEWMAGGQRERGMNVIIRTGSPIAESENFRVKDSTKQKIDEAGEWGMGRPANSIYFAFGVDSKTNSAYTDQDMWAAYDQNWGANAGRWFLSNVKNQWSLLSELRSKTIPSVS